VWAMLALWEGPPQWSCFNWRAGHGKLPLKMEGTAMIMQTGSKGAGDSLDQDQEYRAAKLLLAEANQLIEDTDKAKEKAAALRREAETTQR